MIIGLSKKGEEWEMKANVRFAERMWAAIDVGTTKICVLIAKQLGEDSFDIIGLGTAPSDGLKKGVVINVTKAVESISVAIKEAELMAGIKLESAYVGISGAHIKSVNSTGMIPIKGGRISKSDITKVIESAQAIPIADGQQILHVMPQHYIIDGQEPILDPVGMHGVRLESSVHIITGAVTSVQNLIKCCEMSGVMVSNVILEQLASADAVLSEDEKELGVAVLDIGGGTSDLAVYQNGSIRHTMVLPVAGNHFTNDLAIGLKTTIENAIKVKHEYGSVIMDSETSMLELEIEKVHGSELQTVYQEMLVKILRPRACELLSLVNNEIHSKKLKRFIPSGFVITGGGSLLYGMEKLAGEILGTNVRIGSPKMGFSSPRILNSPIYATSYGLLVHALKKEALGSNGLSAPLVSKVFECMRSWVADFF
ncbi:MAG: Cell division protein ftsA [candidate division TM6 bacterium GW2011_GWF2_32_72]|nr:MAG: Cell division protein ftsA [candidate division TM6 bacterium GW2011_GWF2_32_72]